MLLSDIPDRSAHLSVCVTLLYGLISSLYLSVLPSSFIGSCHLEFSGLKHQPSGKIS